MKNAEKYNSVSPYPFEDAQLPLVITGIIGHTNFTDNEKNALTMLRQNNVPYTREFQGHFLLVHSNEGNNPSIPMKPCYNQTTCKNLTNRQKN